MPATAQPVGGPGRVCALPEVIRAVVLELGRRGIAGSVDARNPGEVTDADGAGARCAVWLVQPAWNTNLPDGQTPRHSVAVQAFQVRRLPHSLAVDLID